MRWVTYSSRPFTTGYRHTDRSSRWCPHPLLFPGSLAGGVAIGCVAILITLYLPLWFNRYNWGRFRQHLTTSDAKAIGWRLPLIRLHLRVDELRIPLVKWKTAGDFIDWRILLTILGNCEYAIKYIDIAVAVPILAIFPIAFGDVAP